MANKKLLIDLLSYFADGYSVENRHIGDGTLVYEIADHLVANGVTVQEWIPADMELPGREEVGKYYAQYGEHPKYIVMITNAVFATILSFDGEEWYDSYTTEPYKVTHWMPLPAAPEKK